MLSHFHEINWEIIPSWIQAFGAVIAAILLIRTLSLQRKTLEQQQVITRLEQKRFLNNHLPLLELNNVIYNKSRQDREVRFDISIKENYLQNLKITDNFPKEKKVEVPYFISDVILPKDYIFSFRIKFTLSSVFKEIEEYTGNTIIFNFEDAFGNKYQQYLIYKGANNLFLHPAIPI